jgi:hypothetical protein
MMTMDLTTVAYATFALSLFVSAIKVGGWILNADPRAIINAGRWSLLALAALAVAALLWLIASDRWPSAMLLMAFMLPIVVQALPRWRLLLNVRSSGFPPVIETIDARTASENFPSTRTRPDPELVRQSIAVLQAYLEHASAQIERRLPEPPRASRALPTNGNGRLRMSRDEALELLGLGPTASAEEINDAHRRLAQRLDPQLGGTPYLLMKIDEAKTILLGEY